MGRDLAGTNANMPRYIASDSDFNGKPVIGTDATAENRDIKTASTWNNGSTTTKYWVFRMYSAGPIFCSMAAGGRSDQTGSHWILAQGVPGDTYYGKDAIFVSGQWLTSNVTYVVCAQFDATSGNTGLYANAYNTNKAVNNMGSTNDTAISLGCSTGGCWRLADYVNYQTIHSSTVREKVMKALGCRYGVAVT